VFCFCSRNKLDNTAGPRSAISAHPIGAVSIRCGKPGTTSWGNTSLPAGLARRERLRNSHANPGAECPVRRIGRDSNNLSEVPARLLDHQANDAADQESGNVELSNSEKLIVSGGDNSGGLTR